VLCANDGLAWLNAATALSLVVSLIVILVSYVDHGWSIRPSATVVLYLVLASMLDIPRLRTFWLMPEKANAAVFTCSFIASMLMIVLESLGKHHLLSRTQLKASPEALSGILSRACFTWLLPLLRQGYTKILDPSELLPISEQLCGDALSLQVARLQAGGMQILSSAL